MITVPSRKLKTEFYLSFPFMDPNDSFIYICTPDEAIEENFKVIVKTKGEAEFFFLVQETLFACDGVEDLIDGIQNSSYKKKVLLKFY